MTSNTLVRAFRRAKGRIPGIAVRALGVPPSWVGYRCWKKETVREYLERTDIDAHRGGGHFRQIHSPSVYHNPLPRNVTSRDDLPRTVGWWGYSFWDVPARRSSETFLATLPEARLIHYVNPANREYFPGILSRDQRSIELREIRFRDEHADLLRLERPPVQRLDSATWILERVYHNYSHWFTAHVPKLLLLRDQGLLNSVVLPAQVPPLVSETLQILDIDPSQFRTYDPGAVLEVGELTVLGSDRFRPELLRSVRDAFWKASSSPPRRRIFVSRAKATRRRLLNEEEIWQILAPAGFERVIMEDLSLWEQVELMAETAVLFAIHGAGLTNMMFCAPGTHVVEIADLTFPNPNFYAVASALEHNYWLLSGTPVGNEHPLRRDMTADPQMVRDLLPQLAGVS